MFFWWLYFVLIPHSSTRNFDMRMWRTSLVNSRQPVMFFTFLTTLSVWQPNKFFYHQNPTTLSTNTVKQILYVLRHLMLNLNFHLFSKNCIEKSWCGVWSWDRQITCSLVRKAPLSLKLILCCLHLERQWYNKASLLLIHFWMPSAFHTSVFPLARADAYGENSITFYDMHCFKR